MKNKKEILFTAVGKQDPYNKSGEEGPIVTLLKNRSFTKVYLFSTIGETGTTVNAKDTVEVVSKICPNMETEIIELNITDPYAYSNIMKELRKAKKICEDNVGSKFYILTGPGLPQMQTCWFLLASSAEIPANLLYVREERFIKKDQPLIGEIDPRSNELPHIENKIVFLRDIKSISQKTINDTIEELGIIGKDKLIQDTFIECAKYAQYDEFILILGETGTGKEMIARLIHYLSRRKSYTFLTINCATLPEGALEAELFGYVKGAFTSAEEDKAGLFEAATGGTLFLDEIGDMPPKAQAALLRAMQENKVRRLGSSKEIDVDVRIIAATNKDIKPGGKDYFREDVFYRLGGSTIELPPLRKRISDIPLLAKFFLKQFNKKHKKNIDFTQDLFSYLKTLQWPGNIRELQSCVHKTAMLAETDKISLDEFKRLNASTKIPQSSTLLPEFTEGFSLDDYIGKLRDDLYEKALKQTNEKQSDAAKLLGVTVQAVHNFLKKNKPVLKQI